MVSFKKYNEFEEYNEKDYIDLLGSLTAFLVKNFVCACGQPFQPAAFKIFRAGQNIIHTSYTCSKCGQSFHPQQLGADLYPLYPQMVYATDLNDLTSADMKTFTPSVVTADQVLEMREYARKYKHH